MIIHFTIPWDDQKNLGESVNRAMKMCGPDDWLCVTDGDTIFLDPFFGSKLKQVVESNPGFGMFTCMTNRVGCKWQISEFSKWDDDNIVNHRKTAEKHWETYKTQIQDVSNVPRNQVLSGVMIMISRKAWEKVNGFKKTGALGIDSDIHWRCMDNGVKVGLMKGIFTYHWYRGGNRNDKRHLQ